MVVGRERAEGPNVYGLFRIMCERHEPESVHKYARNLAKQIVVLKMAQHNVRRGGVPPSREIEELKAELHKEYASFLRNRKYPVAELKRLSDAFKSELKPIYAANETGLESVIREHADRNVKRHIELMHKRVADAAFKELVAKHGLKE